MAMPVRVVSLVAVASACSSPPPPVQARPIAPRPTATAAPSTEAKPDARLPSETTDIEACARSDRAVLRLELSWDGHGLAVTSCVAVDMELSACCAAPRNLDDFSGSCGVVYDEHGVSLFARCSHASLVHPSVEAFDGKAFSVHARPRPSRRQPATLRWDMPNLRGATTLVWFDAPCHGCTSKAVGTVALR